MIFSLICVAVSLLMFLILINTKKPAKYPPGPTFLPIVGNFLEYKKRLKVLGYHHLVWMELSEKYGEVVGLKLGRNLIVSVFGPAAIQEVLEREDFDGRPDGFFFRMRTFGKRLGLVFSDGSFWKGQRKFSIAHLRNFGFARRGMEDKIHDETTSLIEKFKKCDAQPIYMHDVFGISVLNGLWAMMAGERFETDDERLKKLLKIINDCFRIVDISGGLLNQMPFLRHIAPEATGYNKLSEILERMWEFLEETITEHRKTLGLSEQPRDLIEAFLQKIKLNNDPTFTDDQLMSVCLDLFMAGAETTSNTLGFAMLAMLLYPDIQKKIQKELDMEVGRNRWPTLGDKVRLKYTEAVLMEIQRRITIAPLGIAHRAVRDTELYGYNVPEDTIILTNLYSVHMDKTYWKDPFEFKPERFLDEAGNLVQHEGHYIPFGSGKRRCFGESLGKANVFMFFTSVLHNFNIERFGEEELSLEGFDGVTMAPKPFRAKLIYREG